MKNIEEIESFGALPHILVVDDDDRIRELVSRYLTEHGYFVSTAADAGEAKAILEFAEYDALVVDVMMPGQDGKEFTKELRDKNDVPILLLTAMGEIEDKISGLETGADDYLTKPFDPRELILRLEAILRRRPKYEPEEIKEYQIGPWIYKVDYNELVSDKDTVKLTEGEARMLKTLAAKGGDIVSRDDLATACDIDPDNRTVDVQVTRLRRKLEEDSGNPRLLQTVRGKGYLLRINA